MVPEAIPPLTSAPTSSEVKNELPAVMVYAPELTAAPVSVVPTGWQTKTLRMTSTCPELASTTIVWPLALMPAVVKRLSTISVSPSEVL